MSSNATTLITRRSALDAHDLGVNAVRRQRRALTLSVVLDDTARKARLAYAISSARARRGLTPPKLAERLGVRPGTVNKWESGDQMPSLLMLGPLCDALGVDANLFAVLPPIPAWEGESYLMDEAADRAALAGVEGVTLNELDAGDDPPPTDVPTQAHAPRRTSRRSR